jgi:opacity protein-like surface antigen
MKKFNLSLVAVLAMGTFVMAGGDVKDVEPAVEPVVEIVAPVVDDSSFYVGLGYSYMKMNVQEIDGTWEVDVNGNALTVLAGYNFNKYIAVEGRYSITLGDLTVKEDGGGEDKDEDGEISNIALYLKPMYPMGGLTLYGLLGYGQVALDIDNDELSESAFQWGLGASYAVNDNVGLFVDYTRLYDDTDFDGHYSDEDFVIDAINVGVTYKF